MGKRVLVIEDNEENLQLFCTVLKCGGYEPLQAKNGAEGIRVAMQERPNLILMDIQMPVMNGFDAIKILKSESSTKNIPSIALTAEKINNPNDGFKMHGFDDYIPKPVRPRDLIEKIGRHLP